MVHYRKNNTEGFETQSDKAINVNWKQNAVTQL